MRDSTKTKVKKICRLIGRGHTVMDACKKAGLSAPAYYAGKRSLESEKEDNVPCGKPGLAKMMRRVDSHIRDHGGSQRAACLALGENYDQYKNIRYRTKVKEESKRNVKVQRGMAAMQSPITEVNIGGDDKVVVIVCKHSQLKNLLKKL